MKNVIIAALTFLGLTGLSLSAEPKTNSTPLVKAAPAAVTSAGKAQKRESYVVVGFLEGRDRIITLKSSARGPVYSVATKDGKVLFENLSVDQLKAQAPDVHTLIKTSIAGDSTRPRPVIDASVRPQLNGAGGNSVRYSTILDASIPLR